ncbi:MAG TPA: hypothetical protein VF058_01815, partial [Actinomycetota bacterium]
MREARPFEPFPEEVRFLEAAFFVGGVGAALLPPDTRWGRRAAPAPPTPSPSAGARYANSPA